MVVNVVVSSLFVVGLGHAVGVGIVDGIAVAVDIVGLAAEIVEAAAVVGIRHVVVAAVAQQMPLDIEPPEQQQQQVLPLPLMLAVAVAVVMVQLDDIGLEMAAAVVVELDDS